MPFNWTHTVFFLLLHNADCGIEAAAQFKVGHSQRRPLAQYLRSFPEQSATSWLWMTETWSRSAAAQLCLTLDGSQTRWVCVCVYVNVCGFGDIELLKSSDVKPTQWLPWWRGSRTCLNSELFKLFLCAGFVNDWKLRFRIWISVCNLYKS